MKYLFRQITNGALCAMLLFGLACVASAQSKNVKKVNQATERSRKAAKVYTEIMAAPDKAIQGRLHRRRARRQRRHQSSRQRRLERACLL